MISSPASVSKLYEERRGGVEDEDDNGEDDEDDGAAAMAAMSLSLLRAVGSHCRHRRRRRPPRARGHMSHPLVASLRSSKNSPPPFRRSVFIVLRPSVSRSPS